MRFLKVALFMLFASSVESITSYIPDTFIVPGLILGLIIVSYLMISMFKDNYVL